MTQRKAIYLKGEDLSFGNAYITRAVLNGINVVLSYPDSNVEDLKFVIMDNNEEERHKLKETFIMRITYIIRVLYYYAKYSKVYQLYGYSKYQERKIVHYFKRNRIYFVLHQ